MHQREALDQIMERVKPLARATEAAQLRDVLRRRELNQLAEAAEHQRLEWLALHASLTAGQNSATRFKAALGNGQSLV